MKVENVSWKSGVPSRGIDPEIAYYELEAIRAKKGKLTDTTVLEEAKNESHPLHNWFNWDDDAAAEEYRRLQAQNLIRSLVVVYVESPKTPVRAYQVLKKEPTKSESRTVYSTTEEVLSSPEGRDKLIADAIKAAMDFRRRFKMLHELEHVMKSLDEAIESLQDSVTT